MMAFMRRRARRSRSEGRHETDSEHFSAQLPYQKWVAPNEARAVAYSRMLQTPFVLHLFSGTFYRLATLKQQGQLRIFELEELKKTGK
jgi:hypothetical protein